ncbi:MAG: hypothetical protein C0502_10325 [Opitutus sp.]|nr:hypothetical protein [Opitutus sp.]
MDESAIQRLEGLRPSWKREWEALLRSEPTLSPLGNPDTLVYLMDETIAEVLKSLRARALRHVATNSRALLAPLQRHCACGLNPLLNYYATGELALHAVAAPMLVEHLDEALTSYHLLAQKEIDTLCAVCQHRAGSDCPMPAMTGTAHRR